MDRLTKAELASLLKTSVKDFNAYRTEYFGQTDLSGHDFSNLDLTDANMHSMDLRDCNFSGCTVVRTILQRANLTNADIDGLDFSVAYTTGAYFYAIHQTATWSNHSTVGKGH